MLVQKFTRIVLTEHRPVETGAIIAEEGMALVWAKEGKQTVVRPSTGAAGEVFAGVSLSRNAPPQFIPYVSETVVPESLTVELPRLPVSGQLLVRVGANAAAIKAGDPAAAGEAKLSATTLKFHADDVGKPLFIQTMYEPTTSEARQLLGDAPIGGLSSSPQNIIGMITRGDVATTFYDAASDFDGAFNVRLGPDGRFTTAGQGTLLTNVVVATAPGADNTALVLSLRA